MYKTFKTIEEAADAMKNAMWVSNGDPALLEDRTFAEEIARRASISKSAISFGARAV